MKSIQIDEDLYQYIAAHTEQIGESATSILRRLLNLSASGTVAAVMPSSTTRMELSEILAGLAYMRRYVVVDRMLKLLEAVCAKNPKEFEKVLQIRGRSRCYFAKSEAEILKSSDSTQPKKIGNTGYWVMTNSPTNQKQVLMRDVLGKLGYSDASVKAAIEFLS
nr:replication initiation regulator SeqA [Rhodanobacter glycinis]